MRDKATIPPEKGEQGGSQLGKTTSGKNYCTKEPKNQLVTSPGTALEAYLRRYKRDLLAYPQTLAVKRIIENVDALLALRDGGIND